MHAAPHADGPRLLADIGVRHARFALETAPGRLSRAVLLDCAEYRRFEDAVGDYLANRAPLHSRAVRHAVVAIARDAAGAPGGAARHRWFDSLGAAHAALALDTLLVVNDGAAQALAPAGVADAVLAGAATLLAHSLRAPALSPSPLTEELHHAS